MTYKSVFSYFRNFSFNSECNQSYGILLSMTNGLSLSVFILFGQITQNTPEGYNMATFTKIFCIKKYWSELKVCQNSQFFLFTDNSITTHLQSFLGLLLARNQSVDDAVCSVLGLETIESLVP